MVPICLKSSFILFELHILHLTENVRPKSLKENANAELAALQYLEYLLGVNKGRRKSDEDSKVHLSSSIYVV